MTNCDRCETPIEGEPYEMVVPAYSIARLCRECVRLLLGDGHQALGHFDKQKGHQ